MAEEMQKNSEQQDGAAMPQGGGEKKPHPFHEEHHGGPGKLLIFALGVALLIMLAALAVKPDPKQAPGKDTGGDLHKGGKQVEMQEEPPLSESDDVDAIEEDLDNTDLENLDQELSDIEQELESIE